MKRTELKVLQSRFIGRKKTALDIHPFFRYVLITTVQKIFELYLVSSLNRCSLVFKGQNALLQAIVIADMQKYQRRKEVNKCGGYSETSTVHTAHHTTKFKWHGYLRRTTRLGLGIDLPQRNSQQQRQRPDGGAARLGYARASSRKTRPNQRDKFG